MAKDSCMNEVSFANFGISIRRGSVLKSRVIEYAERISRILSEVLKDSGSSVGSDWTCWAMVGTGLLSAV